MERGIFRKREAMSSGQLYFLLPTRLSLLHSVISHIHQFSLLLSVLLIQPPKGGTTQQLHPQPTHFPSSRLTSRTSGEGPAPFQP